MDNPIRIQRSRKKGWRMPPNTVYVGRPSKWGNPFYGVARDVAVKWYKKGWDETPLFIKEQMTKEIRSKNLACWCPLNQPCHADVLLKIANQE